MLVTKSSGALIETIRLGHMLGDNPSNRVFGAPLIDASVRIRFLIAILMLWLTAACGSRAATLEGYALPDNYSLPGQTLVLNGIGIRTLTIFNVRVYVAGLYLPQKSRNSKSILASPGAKVVLLQFLHTASKAAIEKQYRAGEMRNCGHGECAPSDETDFEKLIALTPGAEVGDTLTYISTSRGLRVLFNNRQIGDFANPDLAMRVLLGFIGDTPPSEDLKRHLLGESE